MTDPTALRPKAHELRRHVACHGHRFWLPLDVSRVLHAPIYFFPDQEAFDSDAVDENACATLGGQPLRLPHDAVIFEVPERHHPGGSLASIAFASDDGAQAHLFRFDARRRAWTDVLVHVLFRPDLIAEGRLHADITGDQQQDDYFQAATGMVVRALGLLGSAVPLAERRLPPLHRRSLAKGPRQGWTYRVATIEPDRLVARPASQGGTHASPRWHIRRGHWRQLADSRRVFVRECEVGDTSRGGVVKDYQVQVSEAA
jgi:hypothetical protein